MPPGDRNFEIEFDFIEHALVTRVSDGSTRSIQLGPVSVADFYREYVQTLKSLGIDARVWPTPVELSDTLRFDKDVTPASYDPDAAVHAAAASLYN